jgi:hypothetical protein
MKSFDRPCQAQSRACPRGPLRAARPFKHMNGRKKPLVSRGSNGGQIGALGLGGQELSALNVQTRPSAELFPLALAVRVSLSPRSGGHRRLDRGEGVGGAAFTLGASSHESPSFAFLRTRSMSLRHGERWSCLKRSSRAGLGGGSAKALLRYNHRRKPLALGVTEID